MFLLSSVICCDILHLSYLTEGPMESIKKMKTNKELSEDESKNCEQDVEEAVAKCMTSLDTTVAAKEKELLTV